MNERFNKSGTAIPRVENCNEKVVGYFVATCNDTGGKEHTAGGLIICFAYDSLNTRT